MLLRFITLGVYQLKQAKSYTKEHLDTQGLYTIAINRENNSIIRVKIQSRHSPQSNIIFG